MSTVPNCSLDNLFHTQLMSKQKESGTTYDEALQQSMLVNAEREAQESISFEEMLDDYNTTDRLMTSIAVSGCFIRDELDEMKREYDELFGGTDDPSRVNKKKLHNFVYRWQQKLINRYRLLEAIHGKGMNGRWVV